MQRTRYLVAYDIRDDARLRHVHKVCTTFGYPLQYSVFICDLDPGEKVGLELALGQAMDQRVDSVVLVDLGDPATRGVECFEFMGWTWPSGLPRAGPTII